MSNSNVIQWFPGHMAKTRRLITSSIKLVDIIVEIVDARIPYSSRNPEIPKWIAGKPVLILLNKSDSADADITSQWLNHYRDNGIKAITADCKSGKGLNKLRPTVEEILKDRLAHFASRGMSGRSIRMMVVGVPNVGKSSFINRMAGGKPTKVEDRPGVTRTQQWVSLKNGIELLDMPGVLWPRFEDVRVGEMLAFTGAIKDNVLDGQELAERLLLTLSEQYGKAVCERYKLSESDLSEADILGKVAKKRGMLLSGGVPDMERAAAVVLDEFRAGKIGRITLERPDIHVDIREGTL